ncbi:MAG: hypothetical protein HS115_03400 [Spirochaetales bacterium]|nr:hypothetical protein [Spirochaetales bacterium]
MKLYFFSEAGALAMLLFFSCQAVDGGFCSGRDPVCQPWGSLLFAGAGPGPSFHRTLTSGASHVCVTVRSGVVRCFGSATNGELGYNTTTSVGDGVGPSIQEAGDVPVGEAVGQIKNGGGHVCVRFDRDAIRCWGDGNLGQLGYDSTVAVGNGLGLSIIAAGDVPVGEAVKEVSPGNGHTCALLYSGNVRCWGNGARGRLGYNATAAVGNGIGLSISAAGDVPVGATVRQIVAGGNHTCALLETGAVRCWGRGTEGQLGQNASADIGGGGTTIMAAGDVPLGGTATALALGLDHTCALMDTGSIRCFGQAGSGQLGYGNTSIIGDGGISIIAAGDVPLGGKAIAIAARWGTTCAILEGGGLRCWGQGTSGQLGHNNASNIGDGIGLSIMDAGDIPVGGPVTAVAVGNESVCALLADNNVRCWGNGTSGRLGYNSTDSIGNGIGLSILQAGNVPLP